MAGSGYCEIRLARAVSEHEAARTEVCRRSHISGRSSLPCVEGARTAHPPRRPRGRLRRNEQQLPVICGRVVALRRQERRDQGSLSADSNRRERVTGSPAAATGLSCSGHEFNGKPAAPVLASAVKQMTEIGFRVVRPSQGSGNGVGWWGADVRATSSPSKMGRGTAGGTPVVEG